MHAASASCPGHQGRSGYKVLPLKSGVRTGLPLVPCPECGQEILELVAGAGSQVPGAIFFKCRFHDRDDPSTFPWIMFKEKYERMLIRDGIIGANRLQIEEPVPALSSEVTGMEGAADGSDSAVPMLGLIGGLDAKLKMLVILEEIVVVFTLVIVVFVVVGVIFQMMNNK